MHVGVMNFLAIGVVSHNQPTLVPMIEPDDDIPTLLYCVDTQHHRQDDRYCVKTNVNSRFSEILANGAMTFKTSRQKRALDVQRPVRRRRRTIGVRRLG